MSECWTPDTFDSDCRGTLCCFNGCADVCLPPTERSCHEVTETVEEPKTEIVMKPVCVPVPIEDCTQQVRTEDACFRLFKITLFDLLRWRSVKAYQLRNVQRLQFQTMIKCDKSLCSFDRGPDPLK